MEGGERLVSSGESSFETGLGRSLQEAEALRHAECAAGCVLSREDGEGLESMEEHNGAHGRARRELRAARPVRIPEACRSRSKAMGSPPKSLHQGWAI